MFFIQLTNRVKGHFLVGKDNHSATYNPKIYNKTNNSQFITSIIIITIIAKMH